MVHRSLIVALLCALFASMIPPHSALGQERASIEGRVTTEDGQPIGGASVRIRGLDLETTTDSAGRFVFQALPGGAHDLAVEALGRSPVRTTVAAGGRPIVIVLSPRAIEAPPIAVLLERFQVVGAPEELATIPGSAHVIGPEALADQKLLYDDVHAILRQVPGINIQEEDGYGLRPNIGIRGTGSERSSKISLMEDGVLIAPAPYAAPAAYYFPVAGRMEAIEVRKGSSQIKYGPHTTGGALNLISSPVPDELSWLVDAEGGGNATGKIRARAGDSYDHFGWMAETYQIRSDGFKRLEHGGTGFEVADYLVKLRVHTSPEATVPQALELKLGRTDETSDETYLGLTEEDFRRDPFQRYAASQEDVMRTDHTQLQLGHRIRPASWADVSTVLYRQDFARNWYKLGGVGDVGIEDALADPGAFPELMAVLRGETSEPGALGVRANHREYYAQGVQSILSLELGGEFARHELELSARYHEDQEDRFQHDDVYQMVEGRMVLSGAGAPGSQSNVVSDAAAWAFFAQDEIRLGRWTVTPGVRYETIDFTRTDYAADDPGRTTPVRVRETAVSAVIPGIGASFRATDAVHLFGGVHKGFGPPGPGADRETEPEESVNYELGARVGRGSLGAQIVGFYNDYENILGRQTLATGDAAGAGALFNGGAVEVAGLEVTLDADLAERTDLGVGLPLQLAYTYTRAEFGTAFASAFEPWGTVEAGDELPYVPAHQLHARIGVDTGPWSLALSANHVDEMRTEAGRGPIPEGRGTDAFTVWSASGELRLGTGSTLFVGVQNLADEAYVVARRPAGARPGLPRTLLAGIRISR